MIRRAGGPAATRLAVAAAALGAALAIAGPVRAQDDATSGTGDAAAEAAPSPPSPSPTAEDPELRGEYVFHAAGCAGCHTEDRPDAPPLAGGRGIETPFGIFYGPNITPDPETGIGDWTREDFDRALREGVSPDGSAYFPIFPYTSYTGMTDADIDDLWAYLRTVEPVRRENRVHDVPPPFSWRFMLPVWRALNFRRGEDVITVTGATPDDRGAYLAEALAHCGQCHTPRGPLGGPDLDRHFAGWADGPEGDLVPNITPHPETGIGGWGEGDVTFLLELGMTPEGDFVGGSMNEVIQNTTSKLTAEDREAIARYILSLPPIDHDPSS